MKFTKKELVGHPAADCTQAQRDAFEQFAISQSPRCTPMTIKILLVKGLIVQIEDMIFGTGPLAVRVKQYAVPFHVHMAWCEWCGRQPKIDEEIKRLENEK